MPLTNQGMTVCMDAMLAAATSATFYIGLDSTNLPVDATHELTPDGTTAYARVGVTFAADGTSMWLSNSADVAILVPGGQTAVTATVWTDATATTAADFLAYVALPSPATGVTTVNILTNDFRIKFSD